MKKSKCIGLISILALTYVGCSSENIATVNGINIKKAQYEKSLELVINTNKYLNGEDLYNINKDEKKHSNNISNMVVSFMIDNELLYQESIKNGFSPTKEEVNLKYEEIKKTLNNNSSYKKVVDDAKIDESYLLECIERDLAIEKYRVNFINNIQVMEDEMKSYYNENIDDFYVKEINASHILISTLDRNKNTVNKEEKDMLKKNAYDLLNKINNGESFEELAQKYSDDKITGEKGGKLGYFSINDKNIEFSKEVFKLNKGEISKVIETSYGYHIVKINDERKTLKSFDESKFDIKRKIIDNMYLEHIQQLKKNAYIKKK